MSSRKTRWRLKVITDGEFTQVCLWGNVTAGWSITYIRLWSVVFINYARALSFPFFSRNRPSNKTKIQPSIKIIFHDYIKKLWPLRNYKDQWLYSHFIRWGFSCGERHHAFPLNCACESMSVIQLINTGIPTQQLSRVLHWPLLILRLQQLHSAQDMNLFAQ